MAHAGKCGALDGERGGFCAGHPRGNYLARIVDSLVYDLVHEVNAALVLKQFRVVPCSCTQVLFDR